MKAQTLIALRILEIRKEKKLTQEAVAFKAEVDRTFMNHIENGRKNISIDTLHKVVVHGFEMTLQEFFNHQYFVTGKIFKTTNTKTATDSFGN